MCLSAYHSANIVFDNTEVDIYSVHRQTSNNVVDHLVFQLTVGLYFFVFAKPCRMPGHIFILGAAHKNNLLKILQ